MNEKFNKNVKVEKFTSMLGIAVRLIVIDPFFEKKKTQAPPPPPPPEYQMDRALKVNRSLLSLTYLLMMFTT